MANFIGKRNYQDRLFAFINDSELAVIDTKFEPYFELHKIEDIFDLFDVVQSAPDDAITGKLVWKMQRDLPIELKKAVIAVYNKYFVD
ncbi:hypothetical protein SNE26_07725 [Mucilaginibacter sp. cycad4]|uniref:hypothetical protein n=1 Tax=Mucilaginibacter sp. cycad4 TaxID=3342096 RepID=UPI002AAB3AB4|nr:hypothetical protein [Mucilaginibacter gossypii]WPV01660.1 hypothetical protein SNE26_07725 [Mucilaginibacter gossypii]